MLPLQRRAIQRYGALIRRATQADCSLGHKLSRTRPYTRGKRRWLGRKRGSGPLLATPAPAVEPPLLDLEIGLNRAPPPGYAMRGATEWRLDVHSGTPHLGRQHSPLQ